LFIVFFFFIIELENYVLHSKTKDIVGKRVFGSVQVSMFSPYLVTVFNGFNRYPHFWGLLTKMFPCVFSHA